MVTNTRPAPPWKPPVAVCKSPGGQMTSQQYQLRQQAKFQRQMSYEELMSNQEYQRQMMVNDLEYKIQVANLNMYALQSQQPVYESMSSPPARNPPKEEAPAIPSEYRDLADIGSEMFDPLTCLKNGIPWDARAESKSEKKSPRKVADKGLKIGF